MYLVRMKYDSNTVFVCGGEHLGYKHLRRRWAGVVTLAVSEGLRVITESEIAGAVAGLFEAATPGEAATLEGIMAALGRTRGRLLLIDRVAALPPEVCGRWVSLENRDLLQLQKHGPAAEWTTMHEVGHMVLGHTGRPVGSVVSSSSASPEMVEYMLDRGEAGLSAEELRQETEAEQFAGLLSARLRRVARTPRPSVQARLDDTLG